MHIKRGARPKAPEDRKGNAIQIRLTDAERVECELASQSAGLKMSAWARQAIAKAAKRHTRKKANKATDGSHCGQKRQFFGTEFCAMSCGFCREIIYASVI